MAFGRRSDTAGDGQRPDVPEVVLDAFLLDSAAAVDEALRAIVPVRLRTLPFPRAGERIQVSVRTPTGAPSVVQAEVVWTRRLATGLFVGAKLHDLPARLSLELDRLMTEARARLAKGEPAAPPPVEPLAGIQVPAQLPRDATPAPVRPAGRFAMAATGGGLLPIFRVGWRSVADFLEDHGRFLALGMVVVQTAPPPREGTHVVLSLGVPDGQAPLEVHAVARTAVGPPEFAEPGWIAEIPRPEGDVKQRLDRAAELHS